MKAPKYFAGRELDYYLLWLIGIWLVGTAVIVSLGGCASSKIKNFNCYKVIGPQTATGSVTDRKELETIVSKIDKEFDLFKDKPNHYMCIDVTPIPDLKNYPHNQ